MKKYIGLALVSLGFIACGPQAQEGSLEDLKAQKTTLQTQQKELAAQISALDAQIATMGGGEVSKAVVTSAKMSTMDFEHYFTIHGVVETDQNAQVFPDAAAKITAILVKEGQRVTKGQVIATLHDDMMSSTIKEIETQIALAKDAFEKQERLWNKKIGSEMQFLQAKTNYEALAQKLETVKSQGDLYKIVSPFDGIVDEIFPKVGEMAAPQMPFARVVNLNKMFIEADVSEEYINTVKPGSKVVIEFPSTGDVKVSKVARVGNYINPNNRTFKIRVELPNQKGTLKPNLLADLKIRDYSSKGALVIAPSLIQQDRQNQEFVYVVDGDKVKRVDVKSGMTYNKNTEILEGLTGSEEYIVKGARSVQPGDLIEVKNS